MNDNENLRNATEPRRRHYIAQKKIMDILRSRGVLIDPGDNRSLAEIAESMGIVDDEEIGFELHRKVPAQDFGMVGTIYCLDNGVSPNPDGYIRLQKVLTQTSGIGLARRLESVVAFAAYRRLWQPGCQHRGFGQLA